MAQRMAQLAGQSKQEQMAAILAKTEGKKLVLRDCFSCPSNGRHYYLPPQFANRTLCEGRAAFRPYPGLLDAFTELVLSVQQTPGGAGEHLAHIYSDRGPFFILVVPETERVLDRKERKSIADPQMTSLVSVSVTCWSEQDDKMNEFNRDVIRAQFAQLK